MSASITWEGMDEARSVLRSLTRRTSDLTPLMENIASYGVSSTQSRLKDEKHTPDGMPWADYKDPKYAGHKAQKSSGGLLEFSGMLIRSISSQATRDTAEWGSNREYAARMHYGGGGVIGRKYLGISSRDSRVLKDLIKSYYDNH